MTPHAPASGQMGLAARVPALPHSSGRLGTRDLGGRDRLVAVLMPILLFAVVAAIIYGVAGVPYRTLEAWLAASALTNLGFNMVPSGYSVVVFTPSEGAFFAIVAPSCSALPSLLALGCVAGLIPRVSVWQRARVAVLPLALVAIGNLLRIAASLAVGGLIGRTSLVLFHDWVGSLFGWIYTIAGYVLMLVLLVPARRRQNGLAAA